MSDDFERILGRAAIEVWSSLSRESQQQLFETAIAREPGVITRLGVFLHDRHPKTAHPPKPKAAAEATES